MRGRFMWGLLSVAALATGVVVSRVTRPKAIASPAATHVRDSPPRSSGWTKVGNRLAIEGVLSVVPDTLTNVEYGERRRFLGWPGPPDEHTVMLMGGGEFEVNLPSDKWLEVGSTFSTVRTQGNAVFRIRYDQPCTELVLVREGVVHLSTRFGEDSTVLRAGEAADVLRGKEIVRRVKGVADSAARGLSAEECESGGVE